MPENDRRVRAKAEGRCGRYDESGTDDADAQEEGRPVTTLDQAYLMKDAAAGDMTARNAIADYMQENGKGSPEREAMGAALAAFLRLPAGEPGTVPPAVPNTLATEWPGFAFVLSRSTQKDPWVLVMVGAPGVPIGLLRYEAREIADAFPMGRRPELPASESAEEPQEQEPRSDENQWWAADLVQEAAEEQPEPEIRWADEQTVDEPADPALDEQQVTDFQDWSVAQPAVEEFDLAPPVAASDALDTGDAAAFDLAPPVAASDAFDTAFDLAPPVPASDAFDTAFDLAPPADAIPAGFGIDEEEGPQFTGLSEPDLDLADLADLAPPSGPAIELPPPVGPAFELPPPE